MAGSAAQAIALARSQVGTKENPPGSNRTPYNAWYAAAFHNAYFEACAWCAIFQSWVAWRVSSLALSEMSAGAFLLVQKLVDEGRGLSRPVPGALISWNYGNGHVEMVVALHPDPSFVYTVGGNTGDGNPADGDGVYARLRYMPGFVHAIAMPHYDDQTPATAPTVHPGPVVAASHQLAVDGSWGPATTAQLQRFLVRYTHQAVTVDGGLGPQTKQALQRWVGASPDGVIGPATTKDLQAKVGARQDGVLGPLTVESLQRFLNAHPA